MRLSKIETAAVNVVTSASLTVETNGAGFTDITREAQHFVSGCGGREGVLLAFVRHTSASLTIQENADPDVRVDLMTAFERLAPANAGWVHTSEGPDDMPAHVKTLLSGVSLHIPVRAERLALGTWQGLYLVEHRSAPHRREVILQFVGAR